MLDTFNPILYLFVSYGLGALANVLLKHFTFYAKLQNNNYIGDVLTRKLGVLHLGWLIRKTFLSRFNLKLKALSYLTQDKLLRLKDDMTDAELSHLIAFVIFQLLILAMYFWQVAAWQIIVYTIINIVFNFYLVLLQQYNKRRIDRILIR